MRARITVLVAALIMPGCESQVMDVADELAAAADSSGLTATVPNGSHARTTGNLNLRAGPSASHAVLDVIPLGSIVTITQGTPQNGFYGVNFDGTDGYASGKYLQLSDDSPDAGGGQPPEATPGVWQTIGTGVSYKSIGSGSNVLIVYGGYTAQDAWVKGWTDALVQSKGSALGFGVLYAVRGPNQSAYANQEIANSKLAAHLGGGRAAAANRIVIIAHSSGTFVSSELLGQVNAGTGGVPSDTLSKIELFALDGGGLPTSTVVKKLGGAYFVYACDHAIDRCSHNASSMKSLGSTWASMGGAREVIANGSGCSASASGGLWCLHDTVVTTRPHNPTMYDLANDYTDFGGSRKVVTSYLDVP